MTTVDPLFEILNVVDECLRVYNADWGLHSWKNGKMYDGLYCLILVEKLSLLALAERKYLYQLSVLMLHDGLPSKVDELINYRVRSSDRFS